MPKKADKVKKVTGYSLFGKTIRDKYWDENKSAKENISYSSKKIGEKWRDVSDSKKEDWKEKAIKMNKQNGVGKSSKSPKKAKKPKKKAAKKPKKASKKPKKASKKQMEDDDENSSSDDDEDMD